jgi:signal transduction histidine kinase
MAAIPIGDASAGASWRTQLVDVLLALAVLAATLAGTDDQAAVVVGPPHTLANCLIFAAAAATFLARRFPLTVLVVAAVLDALPYWLPMGGAGYHLSLMIAVYMVVAHTPRRRALPAVIAVLVVQVGLMAWDMDWRWSSMFVIVAALSVVVAAAFGSAARSRALATEAFRLRALAAEESRDASARQLVTEDRLRTARELHDSVAHQIAVMNLNAGVASRTLRERPDEAESALVTVREAGRAVISSISDLLSGLRDGPGESPPHQVDLTDVHRLVDEFRKLSPTLVASIDGAETASTASVSPVLYSVLQEALTNTYKHGQHTEPVLLDIRLGHPLSRVEVANTARVPTSDLEEGFGLKGMRERVVAGGGRLSIAVVDGRFVLRAEVTDAGTPS